MRLIDADKIKQSVTNEMLKSELNSPVYRTLECVIADINNQPAAYDVDKVVERLEDLESYNNDKHNSKPCKFTEGYGCAIDSAIEIVKAGGLDENR